MKSKKSKLHAFVILFALCVLASLLTYLIPSGSYERMEDVQTGYTVVVPGSYQAINNSPVSPFQIFTLFFEALSQKQTASLIFFILIIGGVFEIVMQTGCMPALCNKLVRRLQGKELWVIPVFVFLFSVFGFTMGLTTASVIFVPIGIALASALGLPKMVGISMVALGTNAGFTAGVFNPFSVGIAQTLAEVPLYSGAWMRWVTLIALCGATSGYIMLYAAKHRVKKDSTEIDRTDSALSARQKLVLIEFLLTFIILTVGISTVRWTTTDIVVVFIIFGIVGGLTSGMTMGDVCDTFLVGCKKMMKGVFVIGLAATMRLILTQGNILDTITYAMTSAVEWAPAWIKLEGMFLFNATINFLITSGSSKAVLVMPILTPMADLSGLSRQAAVYAYQMGDGLTNLASPISTTLNGVLAVSDTDYKDWIKFYAPLVGIYLLVGFLLVLFAGLIGY
ncbi:MAG: AbgT family transporter [Pygmaiobacter massiliensis]|nr:AbgT family transporter [Pygmaiobacter massiliensis]